MKEGMHRHSCPLSQHINSKTGDRGLFPLLNWGNQEGCRLIVEPQLGAATAGILAYKADTFVPACLMKGPKASCSPLAAVFY